MTRLCIPIFVTDVEQALGDIDRAYDAGAELVELRVDRVESAEDVRRLVIRASVCGGCIITARSIQEGGLAENVAEMLGSWLAAKGMLHHANYVDVEWPTWQQLSEVQRQEIGSRVILSHHDLLGRPARLNSIELEFADQPVAASKIVWMARTVRDNLDAFELIQRSLRPTIALCMGEAGLISRVLARKFGALLTFAPLSVESATASGQAPIDLLKRVYRWDAISRKTRVYGVVGHPVAHSLSPHVHNAAFEAIGFDAVYVPLLVEPSYESFKAFIETFVAFEGLDLCGLSITIPHKENALRYLSERGDAVDELARRTGAVNTMTIERANGAAKLRGENTDFDAILDVIATALSTDRDGLRGLRAAIIGAGGTGRTAATALAACGCEVTIYNRDVARAEKLSAEIGVGGTRVAAMELTQLGSAAADLFVNATSLGMSPKVNESCFDAGVPKLSASTLVFDTVYRPMETKLLRVAREQGAKVVSGIEMFVRQAEAQFRIWTGKESPKGLMLRIAKRELNA